MKDQLLAHQALGVVEYVNWADENRLKADKSSRYVRGSFDDQGKARQLTHAATADGSVQYLWRASHFEAMSAADETSRWNQQWSIFASIVFNKDISQGIVKKDRHVENAIHAMQPSLMTDNLKER